MHMDVCLPIQMESAVGVRCFTTFMDDYNRLGEVRLIQSNDLMPEIIEEAIKSCER